MIEFYCDNPYKTIRVTSEFYYFDLPNQIHPQWFRWRKNQGGLYVCFSAHSHEFLELIAVKSGKLLVTLDDAKLIVQAGEILIVNPYSLHTGVLPDPDNITEYFCIRIDTESFSPAHGCSLSHDISLLINGESSFATHITCDEAARLMPIILHINEVFSEPDNTVNQCEMTAAVMLLLARLFDTHFQRGGESKLKRRVAFSRAVGIYMRDKFREDISTPDISRALGYTETYFCRLFHDYFGTSFLRYLNKYRVSRAAADYCSSKLPISQIAAEVGFSDYNYFSRVFRHYFGISPREYYRRRTDDNALTTSSRFKDNRIANRKNPCRKNEADASSGNT